MGAYSKDLRLRVLAAAERCVPRKRWWALRSLFGDPKACSAPHGGEDLGPKPSPRPHAHHLATAEGSGRCGSLEANDGPP